MVTYNLQNFHTFPTGCWFLTGFLPTIMSGSLHGCFLKWWYPQIIRGLIGFSMIFTIHFGGIYPYFLETPDHPRYPNRHRHGHGPAVTQPPKPGDWMESSALM